MYLSAAGLRTGVNHTGLETNSGGSACQPAGGQGPALLRGGVGRPVAFTFDQPFRCLLSSPGRPSARGPLFILSFYLPGEVWRILGSRLWRRPRGRTSVLRALDGLCTDGAGGQGVPSVVRTHCLPQGLGGVQLEGSAGIPTNAHGPLLPAGRAPQLSLSGGLRGLTVDTHRQLPPWLPWCQEAAAPSWGGLRVSRACCVPTTFQGGPGASPAPSVHLWLPSCGQPPAWDSGRPPSLANLFLSIFGGGPGCRYLGQKHEAGGFQACSWWRWFVTSMGPAAKSPDAMQPASPSARLCGDAGSQRSREEAGGEFSPVLQMGSEEWLIGDPVETGLSFLSLCCVKARPEGPMQDQIFISAS